MTVEVVDENSVSAEYCSRFLLRIGVTPNCNFTCTYCNPEGTKGSQDFLGDDELVDVLTVATRLGFERVHLTGGEPLLRRGLADILGQTAEATGKSLQYYLTSNGSLLTRELARKLSAVGVVRVNISVDSLRPRTSQRLSGTRLLDRSVQGLEAAGAVFQKTKMNMVILRESNLEEVPDAIRFCQEKGLVLRLMELLPFSTAPQDPDFFPRNHVSRRELEQLLDGIGRKEPIREGGNNWACDYWRLEGMALPIGIVHHHTRGYQCVRSRCMSMRLSPSGQLAACYTSGYPTVNIRGLPYQEKHDAFVKCLREKMGLERGVLEYPRYHIPDYQAFRASIGVG